MQGILFHWRPLHRRALFSLQQTLSIDARPRGLLCARQVLGKVPACIALGFLRSGLASADCQGLFMRMVNRPGAGQCRAVWQLRHQPARLRHRCALAQSKHKGRKHTDTGSATGRMLFGFKWYLGHASAAMHRSRCLPALGRPEWDRGRQPAGRLACCAIGLKGVGGPLAHAADGGVRGWPSRAHVCGGAGFALGWRAATHKWCR